MYSCSLDDVIHDTQQTSNRKINLRKHLERNTLLEDESVETDISTKPKLNTAPKKASPVEIQRFQSNISNSKYFQQLQSKVQQSDFQDLETAHHNQSKVKVIMMAYMRSGSSLLGHYFSDHPQGFYWFEGLSSLYSTLYGMGPFNFVPSITNQNNGDVRVNSPEENKLIEKFLDDFSTANLIIFQWK